MKKNVLQLKEMNFKYVQVRKTKMQIAYLINFVYTYTYY